MALNAVVGALRVNLGMNSAAFTKGANAAEKRLRTMQKNIGRIGASFQRVGAKLSVGLTLPITGLVAKSLDAAKKQEAAVAQVEAALKSMGAQAGYTSEQLQAMASELQGNSLFGDEEILDQVTANLLTFGNVAGEQFARAQQLALDLSARLDQDLKSSAIQLGKALNDPAKGIAALSRVGIQFTEDQKDMIKALTETGRVADAQRLILAELEKQYAGQAAAVAALDSGRITQSWNRIGDAMEKVGAIVLPVVASILERVADLADKFSELDPKVQGAVVAFTGLVGALGPAAIGIGLVVKSIALLLPVFVALVGPVAVVAGTIGLAVAGIKLFGENSETASQPVYDAAAAVAAINGQLGIFYKTEAPKAGQAAIKLANDFRKQAESALQAAEAQLAERKARLQAAKAARSIRENQLYGGTTIGSVHRGGVTGAELDAQKDIEEGLRAVERAERELAEARRIQKRAATAVTGSTYNYAEAASEAAKETKVVVEGLEDVEVKSGGAAKGLDEVTQAAKDLEKELEKTEALLGSIFDGFTTDGLRGAFDAIRQAARDSISDLFKDAFSKDGGGFAGIVSDVKGAFSTFGGALKSVFGGGGFSAIGGAITAAIPVIGAIGAVGSILKGLIGSKTVIGQGFDLGFQDGGLAGGQFTTTRRTALFGLIKSTKTRVVEFEGELKEALESEFLGVQMAVTSLYESLGVSIAEGVVDGVNLAVTRFDARGLSEEEVEAKFAGVFASYGDALSDAIAGISVQAAATLAQATAILKPAGQLFFGTISEMAASAEDLVSRTGGVDALAGQLGFFTDNFFSSAEKIAALEGIVGDALEPLGLAIPKTIDAFKELVVSQNLMTEAGREAYAALLAIAPQFKEIATSASAFGEFDFSNKRFDSAFEEQVAQVAQARGYDLSQVRKLGGFAVDDPTSVVFQLDRIADTLDRMEVLGIPERL